MPLGYRTTIPTNTPLNISPTSYIEVPATLYYNNNPPNVTYAGSQPLFAPYNGGSSASTWSQFPALTNINASNNDLNNVNTGNISSINTARIDLDGNILTTGSAGSNAELLLNGVPIATISSITAIEDWSLYPAISTINVSNYDLRNVSTINGAPYITGSASVWSQFPATQTVDFAQYNLNNVSTINGAPYVTGSASVWSQFPATQTVDFAQYNLNNVSTINGQPYITGSASAWSAFPATQTVNMANNSFNNTSGLSLTGTGTTALLTAGAGNVLNVNGVPVSTGGGANTWADFPAINTVTIPDHDLIMTTTTPGTAYNTANLNANIIIGNGTQSPLRPDLTAFCGTVQLGGIASPLTAMNVNSIGGINLTSLSGVAVSGGGGVSISGAGGVAVTGGGGIALNGGNVEIAGAGGVLVNGTGAIVVTAGGVAVNGGGVAISAGGCAITSGGLSVAGGAVTIGTAGIAGGNLTIYGGDVNINNVGGSGGSLTSQNIRATIGYVLDGAGTFTINGSTGSEGQVIAINGGYPEWTTLPSGTGILDTTTLLQTIAIPGLTTTGVVTLSYAGAIINGFSYIIPTTDVLTFGLINLPTTGDYVVYSTAKLS
jgi:hypothetical protein